MNRGVCPSRMWTRYEAFMSQLGVPYKHHGRYNGRAAS